MEWENKARERKKAAMVGSERGPWTPATDTCFLEARNLRPRCFRAKPLQCLIP